MNYNSSETKKNIPEKLKKLVNSINIATDLSKEELMKIGSDCLAGFNDDLQSMAEWLTDIKTIEDLAGLVIRKKNTPLPNSSNVKLPIITKACYEFSSAVYPEIIRGGEVVKGAVIGYDDQQSTKKDRAERVSKFMNYQLLFEDQEWEEELDTLLTLVGILGLQYKKTYFDPIRKKVKSILCDSKEVIINSNARTLKAAARVSEIIHLKLKDFIEAKNSLFEGTPVYLPEVVDDLIKVHELDILTKDIDIIEMSKDLDLDEDGYPEPYIVSFIKETGEVLRIAPRYSENGICIEKGKVVYIDAISIYTDYHFLKSPKGKFQSVGFGFILLHMTETANSILNQLVDAGQLSNMQGGYKDARLKVVDSGNSLHDPGEWKDVKVELGSSLKDGILPINYKEPSQTLYQLLGFLYDICRDLTASAQINNGTQSSENAKTGATQLLQEAGKKLTNSINKRLYRSLNKELRAMFMLNAIYLDPKVYFNVLDSEEAVRKEDFDPKSVAIFPVADPELASDAKRLAAAQFVMQIVAQGLPGIDALKATQFILKQTTIPNIESILADPNAKQPPNPDMLKLQIDAEHKSQQIKLDAEKISREDRAQVMEAMSIQADVELKKAQALNFMAQAEAHSAKVSLEDLKLQLGAITKQLDVQTALAQMKHEKEIQMNDHAQEQKITTQSTPIASEGESSGI